ncbi:MAG: hypothetical protein J6A74_03885 [Oscillospiraceae bacterium]|nr:hypothetical protein [Oscillospiraceae bacterium]
MAKSFSLTSAAYSGRYLKLECTQTPNVAGNYSDIAWTLTVTGGSSNYYSTGPTQVTIGGNTVYSCARKAYSTKTFPAAKGSTGGTLRVYHNDADGTCTVAVSLSTAIYTASVSTVSGNWTLDSIARASEISATDANIESASTVVITRKNSAFTHSIAYQFGRLSGYVSSSGKAVSAEEKFSATTVNFTLPESFYSQIPNSKTGTGSLTCRTYSGNTLIDTKTCSFTATAAESRCAPLLDAWVEDVNSAALALTGDKSKLIRYVSTARCHVTAVARKSATIVWKNTDGGTLTGDYIDYPQTERAEYHTYTKDSRGYQAWHNVSCELIPYVVLTANVSLSRPEPTGSNVRLAVEGNCYRGSFGGVENTLQVQCRLAGQVLDLEPQWTGSNRYRAEVMLTDLDYTQTHPVEVTVTDAVNTVAKNVTVQPGLPVFDWGKNDFAFHVPVTAPSVSGVSLGTRRVWKESSFSFQSKYTGWDSGGNRQSLFLFGNANGTPVWGVIGIESNGTVWWSGTDGVSVTAETAGRVRVDLGRTVYDDFTLLSAEQFSPE